MTAQENLRESFSTLQAEWNGLLQQSATDTVFLTWEWQSAWWEHFGQEKQLLLTATRDRRGQLTAIVPLFSQDTWIDPSASLPEIRIETPEGRSGGELVRTIHFVGGGVSDYLDIVTPGESNKAVWARVFDSLGEREDWHVLDLRSIPYASPTMTSVTELAGARGWQVRSAAEDVCPVLDLPPTWDDFLADRLDRKKRHELRRKMRKAEREVGVEWYWVEGHGFDDGLQVFLDLHRASDPEKTAFMSDRMEGFFRSVAQSARERGWLRLAMLRFDGHPVASYFCFDYGGERLVYNSGFDVSAYGHLSPGIVLLGYMIEDAILTNCTRFDFLRGDERYKYDLGGVDTQVMRVYVRR